MLHYLECYQDVREVEVEEVVTGGDCFGGGERRELGGLGDTMEAHWSDGHQSGQLNVQLQ